MEKILYKYFKDLGCQKDVGIFSTTNEELQGDCLQGQYHSGGLCQPVRGHTLQEAVPADLGLLMFCKDFNLTIQDFPHIAGKKIIMAGTLSHGHLDLNSGH